MTPGQDRSSVLTIRAPREAHELLKTMAFATGRSINDIVLEAIRHYLMAEAHQETVDGLLERVQERYRVALDKLADL